MYKYMAKRHWNLGIIRLFNDALYEEALSWTPNGLRYHLIDTCVEELAQVNRSKSTVVQLTEATFLDCLEPFFAVAQTVNDKYVHRRVMEKVLMAFLDNHSFVSDAALAESAKEDETDSAEAEEESLTFNQVHVGSVAKFIFELASDPETKEQYRKALYEMHKAYVRKIRSAGRDVDLEEAMDTHDCDDDSDDEARSGDGKDAAVEGGDESDLKGDEEAGDTQMEDVRLDEEKESSVDTEEKSADSGGKKKKKKKKKKDKVKEKSEPEDKDTNEEKAESSGADLAAPVDVKENANTETLSVELPSKKKKKKKNKGKVDASAGVTATEALDSVPEALEVSTPKKQQPKKRKNNSPPSVNPHAMNFNEGAATPPSKEEAQHAEATPPAMTAAAAASSSKRVSFGKTNRCKSHKASMKAMKNLEKDIWDTANRTPDKSILHKKLKREREEKEKETSGKKKRKHSKKAKRVAVPDSE